MLRRACVVLFASGALATTSLAGCGGRSTLDGAADGAADAAVEADAAAEASNSSILPALVGLLGDSGPLACAGCVGLQCQPQILACLESAGCRAVFTCALTTCLGLGGGGDDDDEGAGAGGVDLACLLGCASSDPSGVLPLLGIVQCLGGTCGGTCGSVLGGLGGLGGGGRRDTADDRRAAREAALREVFAPWPELGFTPLAASDRRPAPAPED